ncbi:MAG: C40 family peptidase [Blautia sp.]|nr:C40 family peptidase [Blautia sp.]
MSEKEFKAKERTVQKMSRDGLLEENLRSGTSKRVSQRVRQDSDMRKGDISTDVGVFRHSKDMPADRRMLYAEQEADAQVRGDSSGKSQQIQKRKQARERDLTDRSRVQEEDSPEGGDFDAERSSKETGGRKALQRKRAGQIREETEDEGAGKRRLTKKVASEEDSGDEGAEENENLTSEHSSRMDSVRGHSSALSETSAKTAADFRHDRNKKQVQRYAADQKRKERLSEISKTETVELSDAKEEIASKQKWERLNQEQRKQKCTSEPGMKKPGRLSFDDEDAEGAMVRGSGAGFGRKIAAGAAGAAVLAAHAKVHEAEDENAGVEAAHTGERLAEESVRKAASMNLRQGKSKSGANRRKSDTAGLHKLNFGGEPIKAVNAAKQEAEKKTTIRKFFQKQRYRRMYAAAKKEEKTAQQIFKTSQNLVTKAAVVVQEAFRRNSKVLIGLGILGVFFLLISASVTSCTAVIHGTGSSVVSTTYASTDDEIHKVENAYEDMEKALNDQINCIGNRYPEYDNFRYQIDEISHNPYHLISYFTAKYGEFTYAQVKDELEQIFREQYGISTSGERGVTLTETKKVRVGDSLGQVVTSGYCNCSICCGQWSGGPTASGVYPTAQHTIAVDASNPFVPMGTHVIMNGVEYVVEDTGAFARYGVQFDVYYDNHATAQAHGHQTWDAYLADSNGSREIEVTTTQSVNRMSVTLTNHNLDTVLRNRMTADEEKRYDILNKTFGNRNYLFDLDKIPSYNVNGGYRIPPEALSDVKFANMIREAEKYLGYPYVWGGASPSTSFDCSGFVSWVINNCGNVWNYGRLTAEGLREVCAYVNASDARPGDLIFFQGTYNTSGASHVGIYVGNGMMLHCGNPIQYTSINTTYWQNHFYQFGRLP